MKHGPVEGGLVLDVGVCRTYGGLRWLGVEDNDPFKLDIDLFWPGPLQAARHKRNAYSPEYFGLVSFSDACSEYTGGAR